MAKKPQPNIFVEDIENNTSVVNEEVTLHGSSNILDLPSKGLLGYPETVSYRDILVKDEEILSSATEETYIRVLNGVLKSILNDCDFYEQMTIYDRDFLMMWLWANNYDPVKHVVATCPHCKAKTNHDIDLTKIEIKEIKDNIKVPFEIPISNGGKIFVRLNTVADELFVDEYIRHNEGTSYEYVMLIRSIELPAKMTFDKKLHWVRENIKSKEMGYVKNFHRYFRYGVDTHMDYKCGACGEVTRDLIPFQAEDILMPAIPDDFEKLL